MRQPSTAATSLLASVAAAVVFGIVPVAAQPGTESFEPGVEFATSLGGVLLSLAIGLVVVVVAPRYVERTVDEVDERVGEFLVYGFGVFLGFLVLAFILVVTVVGILGFIVLIPAAILVAVVANAVVSTWIGRSLFTSEGSVVANYLVGAVILLVLSQLPLVGGFINFVLVTCLGSGAVVKSWLYQR